MQVLYEDPQEEARLSQTSPPSASSPPRSCSAAAASGSELLVSGGEQAERAWSLLDTEIRDISLLMLRLSPRAKAPSVTVQEQPDTSATSKVRSTLFDTHNWRLLEVVSHWPGR